MEVAYQREAFRRVQARLQVGIAERLKDGEGVGHSGLELVGSRAAPGDGGVFLHLGGNREQVRAGRAQGVVLEDAGQPVAEQAAVVGADVLPAGDVVHGRPVAGWLDVEVLEHAAARDAGNARPARVNLEINRHVVAERACEFTRFVCRAGLDADGRPVSGVLAVEIFQPIGDGIPCAVLLDRVQQFDGFVHGIRHAAGIVDGAAARRGDGDHDDEQRGMQVFRNSHQASSWNVCQPTHLPVRIVADHRCHLYTRCRFIQTQRAGRAC